MKKLLFISLLLFSAFSFNFISPSFADTSTNEDKLTIASSSENMYVYDNFIVSPILFNVKTGQNINLKIQNLSTKPIYFKVPSMKISVEVPKVSDVVIPLTFSNPTDKTIWFRVQQAQSNNKQGSFNVVDYTPPIAAASAAYGMDDSFIGSIINYDSTYAYTEKPEPTYMSDTEIMQLHSTPPAEEVQKPSKYVRGYW